MKTPSSEAGSFRDPSGKIYYVDDRVLRTVMPCAREDFEYVRSKNLIEQLIEDGDLTSEEVVDVEIPANINLQPFCILEHQKIPFISYPYEWSFYLLKSAALHHLKIQIKSLKTDVFLSDACAYNIQFLGTKPIFIDNLSFRRYRDGEFWLGHRQFCEQFLNPLLLRSKLDLPHNSFYRGNPEGISTDLINKLLKFKHKISLNIFIHVVLQSYLQKSSRKKVKNTLENKQRKLPKQALLNMLTNLHNWISKLEPLSRKKSLWSDYTVSHSYSDTDFTNKTSFIKAFTQTNRPHIVWDIGCNTGEFSELALNNGANYVVGFDSDNECLDIAYNRAIEKRLNFLPLYLNLANPTSSLGWAENERKSLSQRYCADAVFALAIIHHLALTNNIPLENIVSWIVDMAPSGVIEFIPKNDPMAIELLRLREDIFNDYTEDNFIQNLANKANIIKTSKISTSGRKLYWYSRKDNNQ